MKEHECLDATAKACIIAFHWLLLSLKRCHLRDYFPNWCGEDSQTNKRVVASEWEVVSYGITVAHHCSAMLQKLYKNSEFCPCEEKRRVRRRRRRGTRQNQSYRQAMQDQVCNVDLWCWTGSVEAAECVLVHHNLRQMGEVGGSATKEKEKGEKKKTPYVTFC